MLRAPAFLRERAWLRGWACMIPPAGVGGTMRRAMPPDIEINSFDGVR
jgi:hypothetical protein